MTVSDRELKAAAAKVRDAKLSTIPENLDSHAFSVEIEQNLKKVSKKEHQRRLAFSIAKRSVAAVLALSIGLAFFFHVNTEAQASVIKWMHQHINNRYIISFRDKEWNGYLPYFEITAVPEGMECIHMEYTYTAQCVQYQNPETKQNITIYSRTPGYSFVMEEEFELSYGSINGIQAEIYTTPNAKDYCRLLWYDEDNKITFYLSSDLGVAETIHIAESIVLSDYSKK